MNTSIQGALAEEQAARYLSNKGYRILTRNFHATGGEIDIVSSYKKMLIAAKSSAMKEMKKKSETL